MSDIRTTIVVSLLTSATVAVVVTLGLPRSGPVTRTTGLDAPSLPRVDKASDASRQDGLARRVVDLERQVAALEEPRAQGLSATAQPTGPSAQGVVTQAVASALQDERAQILSRRIAARQERDVALLEAFRAEVDVSEAVAQTLEDAYFGATSRHITLITDAEDGMIPWEDARAAMQESWDTGRNEVRAALDDAQYRALVALGKQHSTVLYLEDAEAAVVEPLQ